MSPALLRGLPGVVKKWVARKKGDANRACYYVLSFSLRFFLVAGFLFTLDLKSGSLVV